MTTNDERWRCLVAGCNPVLNAESAAAHKEAEGHRVAKWPVRSAEGVRRAKARNKSGYYDKYNVGEKSYGNRFGGHHEKSYNEYIHPFSEEAFEG